LGKTKAEVLEVGIIRPRTKVGKLLYYLAGGFSWELNTEASSTPYFKGFLDCVN